MGIRKKFINWIDALFVIVLLIVIFHLVNVSLANAKIGLIVTQTSGQYRITEVYPFDQADQNKIQVGDLLLEVNGRDASEHYYVEKYRSVEQADTLRIQKQNGDIQEIHINNEHWLDNINTNTLFFTIIIPVLFLLIFLLMSFIVYVKKKEDNAARLLILFFISVGMIYFASPASGRLDLVGKLLMSLLPLCFCIYMYFMNVYLARFKIRFVKPVVIHTLTAIVVTQFVLSGLFIVDAIDFDIIWVINPIFLALIAISYLICLYRLIVIFKRYRYTKLNPLFKFMLVAHAASFIPFVLSNVITLFFFKVQLLPASFSTLFLLALPVSYLYLFTSNRLFDIDFMLTRFKYYTALSILPALGVLLFIVIIFNIEYDHTWVQWFQIYVVIHIGFTLFLYLKELIDYKFRPKFFKQMYSYQDSLDRFSRSMARVMKKDDLIRAIEQEVSIMLPYCRYQFLTVNSDQQSVTPAPSSDVDQAISKALLASAHTFQIADVITMPHGVALIIGKRKDCLYVLWIGNKNNRTLFNVDELQWLKTIANYTSIVHENLYFLENLMEQLEEEMSQAQSATTSPWLLRLLFLLSENERRRLASDLHDSALQDQLIWYRRLETFMVDNKLSAHMHNELYQIREGLLDVIHQIRETCNELRPPLINELGIVEAIQSLTDHLQLQVNFAVILQSKPVTAKLSEEQITAVYRIMQELLRNTEKHAKANQVIIDIKEVDHHIHLTYKDDGIGMNLENMQSSFSRMGLSGIRERVISLEGSIEFLSEAGMGLSVHIIIPISLSNRREEM
ncbi:ATP-binding protein [Paenibacillus taiwanensis]|uniref:ATP-binding protein n=1 Tax=Paenibacillus taiwanensis TaxID=401638 RepID=UPI00041531D4|nr:ATP-binding protein [Paenibacillus taiwanensis]